MFKVKKKKLHQLISMNYYMINYIHLIRNIVNCMHEYLYLYRIKISKLCRLNDVEFIKGQKYVCILKKRLEL